MLHPTAIDGVFEIRPARHGDARGWLSEVYHQGWLAEHGIDVVFTQDNMSFSADQGTIRGLHFQKAPFAQDKLVSCLSGRILDVAVDIRPSSPTFGQSVALELSAEHGNQMFVPKGFAHGFCTLTPGCQVFYKLSAEYAPELESAIAFDDPALGIDWPVTRETAHLSQRDQSALPFAEALAGLSDGDVV